MATVAPESALDPELFLHPSLARELLEKLLVNEELRVFFAALSTVDPQEHDTGFLLSPERQPQNPRLKELDEMYARAAPRPFPSRADKGYDTETLTTSLEALVPVDGRIHVFHGGLIVASHDASEIRTSADAYEAAAPERRARERSSGQPYSRIEENIPSQTLAPRHPLCTIPRQIGSKILPFPRRDTDPEPRTPVSAVVPDYAMRRADYPARRFA